MIAINNFQVVERLAIGGTGAVYLARRGGNEQYALKVLRHENLATPDAALSLQHEAEVLAALRHPNVVRLLDTGTESGEPFLVIEYIDGLSLVELLSHPVPIPLSVGVAIIKDLLAALAYIHDVEREGKPKGIVHGDISPQNVLVGLDGKARLIDFAGAREPGLPARDSFVRCKSRYASPELLAGEPLGPESDLFAAGAILFQLLTGRRPFSSAGPEALVDASAGDRLPLPSEVSNSCPRAFDRVCRRALERQRSARFQRAEDMLTALSEAAASVGIQHDAAEVGDWVRRAKHSRSGDVDFRADEIAALVSRQLFVANQARPGTAPERRTSTSREAQPSQADEALSVAKKVAIALSLLAIVAALAMLVYALSAPNDFAEMFSRL